MSRYVWNKAKRKWVLPKQRRQTAGPYVQRDLPAYMSPMGTGMIEGRSARREDMARSGSREVDPSEKLPYAPKSEKQAAAEKASLDARRDFQMAPETFDRLRKG